MLCCATQAKHQMVLTCMYTAQCDVTEKLSWCIFVHAWLCANFLYCFRYIVPLAVPCRRGHWYNATSRGCVACDIGEYKADVDSLSCTPCPAGTSTKAVAASSSDQCIRKFAIELVFQRSYSQCIWRLYRKGVFKVLRKFPLTRECITISFTNADHRG